MSSITCRAGETQENLTSSALESATEGSEGALRWGSPLKEGGAPEPGRSWARQGAPAPAPIRLRLTQPPAQPTPASPPQQTRRAVAQAAGARGLDQSLVPAPWVASQQRWQRIPTPIPASRQSRKRVPSWSRPGRPASPDWQCGWHAGSGCGAAVKRRTPPVRITEGVDDWLRGASLFWEG